MKKKVVGLFVAALLFVPCLLACAGCSWLKGGKDKVLIDSAKEFVNKVIDSNKLTEEIGANGRRKTQYTYLLTKDLDFSGIDYVPIDTFYDILDGDGHTIKNLTIQAGYDKAGLFQTLEVHRFADYTVLSGTVKNLKFENVTIKANDYVGAVAGYIGRHISEYSFPVLENIEVVSGSIEGKDYVGGLVGAAGDNYILLNDCKNLVNRANVTGDQHVGGVFGMISQGEDAMSLSGATNYGNVVSTASYYPLSGENKYANVGGIIGSVTTDKRVLKLSNLYNYGDVTCDDGYYVGGIVGNVFYKHIASYHPSGDNGIQFEDCCNIGNVYGRSAVGGIVGQIGENHTGDTSLINRSKFTATKFTNCKNHGRVESNDERNFAINGGADYKNDGFYVGGILGRDYSTEAEFFNCRNVVLKETDLAGADFEYDPSKVCIIGCGYVGGIVGAYGKTFSNCTNDMDIKLGSTASTESSFSFAGGICGSTYNTMLDVPYNPATTRTFDNCINKGDVIGFTNELASTTPVYKTMGGIVGYAGKVDMEETENTGNVYGTQFVGGIFGELNLGIDASLEEVKNTGTIYVNAGAIGVGSIAGAASGNFGKADIDTITIGGSVQTKGGARAVAGLFGFWGDLNYIIYLLNIYETTQAFAPHLELTNVTFDFSVGIHNEFTYYNVKTICGGSSTPDDDLSINDSYELDLVDSTYTD